MSARPRLLLSVHSAARGGAELMALAEARHLRDRFELTIAIPDGPLREEFARCGTLVQGSPRLPLYGAGPLRWASRGGRSAVDAVRLAALIRLRGIRLVLVNSMVSLSPLVAARLAGVPAILNPRYDASQAAPQWYRSLFPQMCWLEGALADTIVAISDGIERQFGRARRARIVRIPDGIPIPATPPANGNGFHSPLRLCMVGGVDRVKSQDVAVAALGELSERKLAATLDLIGPIKDETFVAALREQAEKLGVADRLRFRGEAGGPDEAFDGADVVLHTSRGEATPLVVMEALARCKPVVTTRVGDIARIVDDGETGYLTQPGDARAVATAVESIAADPARAREMASEGRRRVASRVDLERTLAMLDRELERALAAR